jgi:hypothetical protein
MTTINLGPAVILAIKTTNIFKSQFAFASTLPAAEAFRAITNDGREELHDRETHQKKAQHQSDLNPLSHFEKPPLLYFGAKM